MKRRGGVGFSLLELLVVIAIVAILVGIAAPNYLRWRATTITAEAAQQFARDVDRWRTEAKRENGPKSIRVASEGASSYELIDGASSGTVERTVALPAGTTIVPQGSTNEFTFSPPYGTIQAVPSRFDFVIRWNGDSSISRTVRVLAVMGKVIIQ